MPVPKTLRTIGPDVLQYIADHSEPDDDLLVDLKHAAEKEGLPPIWISPTQARLIQILVKIHRPRLVVELGTLGGYSAISIGRALKAGARLLTFEIDSGRATFARKWIERAGLSDRVEVRPGDARELMAELSDDSVDMLFIDADKEGYETYLDDGMRVVKRGGLVLADNALGFGEILDDKSDSPSVQALRRFNARVARERKLDSVIVPMGDGFWVAIKEDST